MIEVQPDEPCRKNREEGEGQDKSLCAFSIGGIIAAYSFDDLPIFSTR
ncbi:hypothetical protein G7092_06175 [Mucilaginibacter sp. HC2]|nr:hypothetical protein [Mucilaginibacter inviolabilis]NHA03370.1 hypothetical protein [Mucilaginibacter inviolabilis]